MRRGIVILVIGIGLWLPCWIGFLSLTGCAPGRTGLVGPISDQAYHTITNATTSVSTTASQVLPPPWNTAVEAGAAAVLALLGAWQGITHSKVKTLEAATSPPAPKGTT